MSDDANDQHPDNKKFSGEGWEDLHKKKRHCTDCLCLLLLGAAWFTMTVIGFIVCGAIQDSHLKPGNPNRLTHAIDYSGRICGFTDGVKNRPVGYYMTSSAVVCVKSCPEKTDYSEFICYDEVQHEADTDTVQAWNYIGTQECLFKTKSKEFINRCIPQPFELNTTLASQYGITDSGLLSYTASTSESYMTTFFASLWYLRGYIFGFGIGIAVPIAFLYLYLLRIPGLLALIIWTILLSILVVFLVGAFLLWDLANQWNNDDDKTETEVNSMYVFSYIFMGLSGLYICLLLVMRKRIMLAIGIVKESARALGAMPILIFMPIIQTIGLVIFLVPWTIYVLYLASSGDIKTYSSDANSNVKYRTFDYDTNTKYAFLYMLFTYFWTSEFIIALGQITIAASFAGWYFTREKSLLMNSTVFWAGRTAVFYHAGTAAYGSLIIAILKTIQAVLNYLKRKAKKSKNHLAKVLMFILSCLSCCMWCLEKCMKFLNKNAYIQTAIHGYGFCKACRAAFFLILRNVLRVMGVSMVGDFVLLMGKVLVPCATVFLCYLALAYGVSDNSYGTIIAPLIFVFILAYFVSAMFCEVFGMGITTIMHCFISDEEMFSPDQRFADGALRTTWQKTVQSATADGKVAPENNVPVAEPTNEKLL